MKRVLRVFVFAAASASVFALAQDYSRERRRGQGAESRRRGQRARRLVHRPARLGLHARRDPDAQHRLLRLQPRVELPQPARVDRQLRRQQEARVPHLHARGILGRDRPRLRQGRGKADGRAVPRERRAAARRHGGLQRLGRPRAGDDVRRQRHGREQAPSRRRVDALRAGPRGPGTRLHQVGRPAGLAAALRGVHGARVQDGDVAAPGAGADHARHRPAGGSDPRREALHPQALALGAAAGRRARPARSRQDARRRSEPGDRRRPLRALAGRRRGAGEARRKPAGAGDLHRQPHEHAERALPEPVGEPSEPDPERGRDPDARGAGPLGHAARHGRPVEGRAARRQARRQGDPDLARRLHDEVELPGLPALLPRRPRGSA